MNLGISTIKPKAANLYRTLRFKNSHMANASVLTGTAKHTTQFVANADGSGIGITAKTVKRYSSINSQRRILDRIYIKGVK